MQRLEVSGAVRPQYWPLGVKGLKLGFNTEFPSVSRSCTMSFALCNSFLYVLRKVLYNQSNTTNSFSSLLHYFCIHRVSATDLSPGITNIFREINLMVTYINKNLYQEWDIPSHKIYVFMFFVHVATAPSGPRAPHNWVFTITPRHTTLGRTHHTR